MGKQLARGLAALAYTVAIAHSAFALGGELPKKTPETIGLRIDKKKRKVTIDARACETDKYPQLKGAIEYVLVSKGGKAYEALFETDVPPETIRAAFLSLRVPPGFPADERRLPRGGQFRVRVELTKNGKPVRLPVDELVVTAPADVGQAPDGGKVSPPTRRQTSATAADLPDNTRLLKSRNFWVLVIVVGLSFCGSSATLTHMVPRLTDTGISLQAASLVMSLTAGLGVAGKLSFGWLADHWSARHAVWLSIACQIAGQLLMFGESLTTFALGAALFGYGMGGVVPLQGALVAQTFGQARFGKALGSMRPAMFPLQIVGVPLAGWIFDVTGSYDPAFGLLIGAYALAGIAVLAFDEKQRRF